VVFDAQRMEYYWDNDPSKRTILYYAYALMREQNVLDREGQIRAGASIRSDLIKTTSVETDTFDQHVRVLVFHDILLSEESCVLTVPAFGDMDFLLERTLGSGDPIPLDGLKIYRAKSDKERFERWVEAGSQCLVDLFGEVDGLQITFRDDGKRARLVIFETTIYEPYMIWWFINTKRMNRMNAAFQLQTQMLDIHRKRLLQMERDGVSSVEGLQGAGVVAAPTYKENVASEAHTGVMPALLIGPINLAALQFYLNERRPRPRDSQYRAILKYLHGGVFGGIIFSNELIAYLEQVLRSEYLADDY
jgi:hypothetical protein